MILATLSMTDIGAEELVAAITGLALAIAAEAVRLQREKLQRRRGRKRTRRQDARRSPGVTPERPASPPPP